MMTFRSRCMHGVPYMEPCDDCGPVVAPKLRTIVTSEKDKILAHEILMSGNSRYFDPTLEDAIVSALTAIRREEREAMFKVLCAECTEGNEPALDRQARWYYHEANGLTTGCSASKLRLEAAASAKEK